jgi:DNA-directed RNA polymerase subunit alpha
LEELGLSTRVLHTLKEEEIDSVRALLALNLRDLKSIPGIGERALEEIRRALAKRGFTLKE